MIYKTLEEFKKKFQEDLVKDGRKKTEYLIALKKEYEEAINNFSVLDCILQNDEVRNEINSISNFYFEKDETIYKNFINGLFKLFNEGSIYNLVDYDTAKKLISLVEEDKDNENEIDEIIENYLIENPKKLTGKKLSTLQDELIECLETYSIKFHITKHIERKYKNKLIEIKDFISYEIDFTIEKGDKQIIIEEEPPLTKFQKQIIALLIESGIIDLLTKKYNAKPLQIGVLFKEITKEPIDKKTVANAIKKDGRDYAINNNIDLEEARLRLKRIFKNSSL